jgi:hypothetical protein
MHTLRFYFLLYKKPRFSRDDFYAAQESDTEDLFSDASRYTAIIVVEYHCVENINARVAVKCIVWLGGVLMLNSIVIEGTPIVKRPLSR